MRESVNLQTVLPYYEAATTYGVVEWEEVRLIYVSDLVGPVVLILLSVVRLLLLLYRYKECFSCC